MRIRTRQNHMIDFLFPVALLFVFAVSALTVILLATNVYRHTTENSSLNYTARTSLSYISEKIRQNDAGGSVYLGQFDGCDALVLEHTGGSTIYRTYIYVYEKELKELLVRDGVDATAAAGQTILEVKDFTAEEVDAGLYRFSCTDENGQTASTIAGIRSHAD